MNDQEFDDLIRAYRIDDDHIVAPDRFDEIQRRVVRAEARTEVRAERRRTTLTRLAKVLTWLVFVVLIGLMVIGMATVSWWWAVDCWWWRCV